VHIQGIWLGYGRAVLSVAVAVAVNIIAIEWRNSTATRTRGDEHKYAKRDVQLPAVLGRGERKNFTRDA
jgi:hypothetical protein